MENMTLPPLEDRQEPKTYKIFKEPLGDFYPDEYARDKAAKLGVLLKDANPGVDVLQADLTSGGYKQWQDVLKTQEDNANLVVRNELVRQIASSRDPSLPVTREEVATVDALTSDELYANDVSTIFEKKYADLFTNKLMEHPENVAAKEAFDEDPEKTLDELDRSQFPMMRNQIYADVVQSMSAKYQSQGWADWFADQAKSMLIPGYDAYKQSNRIEVDGASWLPGNNIEDQMASLWDLPPAEFKDKLKEAVDSLAADNIALAQSFLMDLGGQSEYQKLANNVGPVVEVGSLVPVTKVGKLAAGLSKVGKAVTRPVSAIPEIAAEAGFNRSAAIGTVTTEILSGELSGVTTINRIQEIAPRLPSIFNPEKIISGSSRLDAEATARLRIVVQNNANKLLNILGAKQVDRLEPGQLLKAISDAQDEVVDMFPSNTHNIIDTVIVPAEKDAVTNLPVLVTRFGKRDGTPYQSEAAARRFAKTYIALKTDDYTIEATPLGGYFIKYKKVIPDVNSWRTATIDADLGTPDTFDGYLARFLRSPDYFVSTTNVQARGRVVHGSEKMARDLDEITQPFRVLPKQSRVELDAMFRVSRVNQKYFDNIGDFETAFYKKFSKVPTPDQYEAYALYRQINDFDYMVRDAAVVKGYSAAGFEQIKTRVIDKAGEAVDEDFIGKVVDKLPPTDRKYKVRIIENGVEKTTWNSTTKNFSRNQELLDRLLEDGYKIVEHVDKPVYTVMKDFKRNSVKMRTLGYREGGHFQPKYSHYISQGSFLDIDTSKVFTGDLNLGTAATDDQARKIAALFDTARVMVRDGVPGAGKFIEDNLPISYATFKKKVAIGDIKLDVPIVSRRAGQSTTDVFKYETLFPGFENYKYSTYNPMSAANVRYGTERTDLLDVYAHDGKFAYKTNWEPLMDPMDALASATRNMINVRLLDDYAMKSANDWIQEFGHMLATPTEAIKANPRYYLSNPSYRTTVGTDKAEAARLAMLSIFDELDHADVSRLAYRDKVLNKLFDLRPDQTKEFNPGRIYTAKDASSMIRAAAFHMKLGFWNPRQYFLQSSMIAGIVAISPRHGMKGMFALPMTRLAINTGDKNVIRGLYGKMGKFSGWEREDWVNMVDSFQKSGMASIGGDTAYLDRVSVKGTASSRLRESRLGKLAATSKKPFEEGELAQRITAYATAWSEFRAANPNAVIDRFAESKILQRSKDMTFNMTRESNAKWQRNELSVMTQFWGYQARIAESMWDGGLLSNGKKLSRNEKLRLMAMMGTLYGSGTAVSMNLVFVPTTQIVKQWMSDEGIDVEDPMMKAFIDGAPSALMKTVLGADLDMSSFGPTGMPTIVDLINQDKDWGDVLLGAGPGVIGDVGSSLGGLSTAMGYSGIDLTADDLLAVLRNVSTIDNATKAVVAMNTGKYISKRGNYVTDVSTLETMISSIWGTSPMAVSDTYIQMRTNKRYKDDRTKFLRVYEEYARKAARSLEAGDHDNYMTYLKRRDALGIAFDILPTERSAIAKKVMFDTSMTEKMAQDALDLKNKYETFSKDN